MREVRGRAYRERLARLTDDQWRYAVACALDEEAEDLRGWFPTIDKLHEYAAGMPRPVVERPLLTQGYGEQVTTLQGMAIFRAELERLGVKDPTLPPIEDIVAAADKEARDGGDGSSE